MITEEQKDVIQEAIYDIDSSDSTCTCHIIKSCTECETHLRRMKIIHELQKIIQRPE